MVINSMMMSGGRMMKTMRIPHVYPMSRTLETEKNRMCHHFMTYVSGWWLLVFFKGVYTNNSRLQHVKHEQIGGEFGVTPARNLQ